MFVICFQSDQKQCTDRAPYHYVRFKAALQGVLNLCNGWEEIYTYLYLFIQQFIIIIQYSTAEQRSLLREKIIYRCVILIGRKFNDEKYIYFSKCSYKIIEKNSKNCIIVQRWGDSPQTSPSHIQNKRRPHVALLEGRFPSLCCAS